MKRIMKFLRTTLWIGVIVALVVVGIKAFNPMMDKYQGMAAATQNVQQYAGQLQNNLRNMQMPQLQHMQQAPHKRMEQQRQHAKQVVMFHVKPKHHGFGIWKLLGALLLLVAGWFLWKRGGVARFIGGLLIAIALLPLLPLVLTLAGIAVLGAAALYLILRALRRKGGGTVSTYASSPTIRTIDYLDEWEAKTRRQLNNKEEEQQ